MKQGSPRSYDSGFHSKVRAGTAVWLLVVFTVVGRPITDAELARSVAQGLGQLPETFSAVGVRVHNGIVALSGSTATYAKKRRARHVAGEVGGIRDIDDRIRVLPSGRTDKEIADDVQKLLGGDSRLVPFNIAAHVKEGIVVLSGEVASLTVRDGAEGVAAEIPGVRDIVNMVRVVSPTMIPDAEIAADIRRLLAVDTVLCRRTISVRVSKGVAIFSGSSVNVNERERLLQRARVPGCVGAVVGALTVAGTRSGASSCQRHMSDHELQRSLQVVLGTDYRTFSDSYTVEVEGTTVFLSGRDPSPESVEAALELIRGCAGVDSVNYRSGPAVTRRS